MMRKIGINRPNKLSLASKKVAPPTIPNAEGFNKRISGVFSDNGAGADTDSFNRSFDSFNSDGQIYWDGSSREGSTTQSHHEFKEPYQVSLRANVRTPSSLGSPGSGQDLSPTKSSCRNSMSSIDSGWASNQAAGGLSSFCSRTSSSSLNSDKTSASVEDKRFSSTSSQPTQEGQAYLGRQRESSSMARESSKSSVYSSSSSLGSSRGGDDIICTLDINQMINQGLSDKDIVTCWLSSLQFEEYTALFSAAGYDMPTISRMTPEDLTAIGIKKPHHRKKLKSEILKLNIPDGLPLSIPPSIEVMMTWLRLEEYLPMLLDQGYKGVKDVLTISVEDLEDIGFYRLGHQKRLLLGIRRVKELQSGQRTGQQAEYQPEQMGQGPLVGKQSFSSFQHTNGASSQSSQLRFPNHMDEDHPSQKNGHRSSLVCHEASPRPPILSYQPELMRLGRSSEGQNRYSSMYPDNLETEGHCPNVANSAIQQPSNMSQSFTNMQPQQGKMHQSHMNMRHSVENAPQSLNLNQQSGNMLQSFNSMPQPMAPLSGQFYQRLSLPDPPREMGGGDHTSVWQRFPSSHQVQVHTEHGGATMTRESGNGGTLPRPTAKVKPLPSRQINNDRQCAMETENDIFPAPPTCDELLQPDLQLPFANEQSGTIKLKTNPQEAMAQFEKEEMESKSLSDKNLLKTPTRASNRTAGDVMDDISSMLADLTDELDSMLCHESA